MEVVPTNSVVISIKEYDELREMKKNIEAGKCVVMEEGDFGAGMGYKKYTYYTDSEILKLFEETIRTLNTVIQSHQNHDRELFNAKATLLRLKDVSCREFEAWKRGERMF